ncbi:MAG: histidine phosphatase family protein [Nanoarchaeota archaeon]|nr:histidine phosphatase family protein [Nanoarchaeota archaeon]
MRIYFVRHGQSNYNVGNLCNDDPKKKVFLTELGKKQAEKVRANLKNEQINGIFVSQLPRTMETAKIINSDHHAPIMVDSRINDRKTGFEGKSYFDYIKAIEKDRFNIKPKGGESFQEEKKRVYLFIEDLKKLRYRTVLVVCHEETIKIAHAYFNHLSDEEMPNIKVDNGQLIEFEM